MTEEKQPSNEEKLVYYDVMTQVQKNKIDDLNKHIVGVETDKYLQEYKISGLNKRIDELTYQLEAHVNEIAHKMDIINLKDKEIEKLNVQIEEMTKNHKNNSGIIQKQGKEINDLKKELGREEDIREEESPVIAAVFNDT